MHLHGAHFHGVQTFKQTHLSKNKYICRKTVLLGSCLFSCFWLMDEKSDTTFWNSEFSCLLQIAEGNIWSQLVYPSLLLLMVKRIKTRSFHPVMDPLWLLFTSCPLLSTSFWGYGQLFRMKTIIFILSLKKSFLRNLFQNRLSVILRTCCHAFNISLDFINLTYPSQYQLP